jgi:hypothetical protein
MTTLVTPELEQALDLWQRFTESQNQIIKELKTIPRDNKTMWNGYLHQWTNYEWRIVLEAVGELLTTHPEVFKGNQRDVFVRTVQTLLKYETSHDRCLDTKMTKSQAWNMSMVLRELWNQCQGDIQPRRPSPLDSYRTLFM